MKRWKRFIMRIGFSGFQGFRLDRKGREVRALDEVHQFRRVVTRTQVVINLCHSSLKHWQDVVFAGILFLGSYTFSPECPHDTTVRKLLPFSIDCVPGPALQLEGSSLISLAWWWQALLVAGSWCDGWVAPSRQ